MSSSTANFSYAVGYAFDWMQNPEWNDPALRSPIPCRAGYNCTYAGVCSFVHPGEEGAGRRLFPARSEGEKDMVRLFHPYKKPEYYRRRELRLSWPEWCIRQGFPAPVAPQRPEGGVAPSGKRKQRIVLAENSSNVVQTYTVSMPIYQLPAPQRITLEELMASYEQNKEAAVVPTEESVATQIYVKVDALLQNPENIDGLKTAGWYVPSCTASKITGMIKHAATLEQMVEIRDNNAHLFEVILDCCQELVRAAAEQDAKDKMQQTNVFGPFKEVCWGDIMAEADNAPRDM